MSLFVQNIHFHKKAQKKSEQKSPETKEQSKKKKKSLPIHIHARALFNVLVEWN